MERKEKISRLDYHADKILPALLAAVEYLAILAAQKVSLVLQNNLPYKTGVFYLPDVYFYFVIPALYIFFMFYTQVHEKFIPFWETMRRTFYAVLYSEIFCITAFYLFKTSNYVSRAYVVIFFFLSFICLYLGRQILVKVCNRLNIMKEPVLFIGGGKTAENIIYFAGHNNCFGIKTAGIVDDNPAGCLLKSKYSILPDLKKAVQYIKELKVKVAIIAIPSLDQRKLKTMIEELQPQVRRFLFVPNTMGMPIYNLEVKKLYESSMVLMGIKNNLLERRNRILKRIFDVVLSIIGMVIVIPVSLIVCVAILIESPGAAPIFKHYRVGKDGKLFPCYKFRSMVPHAQEKLKDYLAQNPEAKAEWQQFYKLKHDPRITKIGKFLRKTSIDELPQVLNVIKGEMSLVGPRPIIRDEEHYYGNHIKDYYSVLPGITGMWQANGRSDTGYDERVELDVWYVRNWSIWIDVALLCKTVKAVFFGKGAY